MFGESLQLSEDQLSQLLELNQSVLSTVPPDVGTLSSLDQYRARRQVLTELWEGVGDILYDEQLEDWPAVRKFSENAFSYGGRFSAGTDSGIRSRRRGPGPESERVGASTITPLDLEFRGVEGRAVVGPEAGGLDHVAEAEELARVDV